MLLRHYFFGCVASCFWLLVCVSWRFWKWVELFCFTFVHGAMLVFLGCGCGCMLSVFWVLQVSLCLFCLVVV